MEEYDRLPNHSNRNSFRTFGKPPYLFYILLAFVLHQMSVLDPSEEDLRQRIVDLPLDNCVYITRNHMCQMN